MPPQTTEKQYSNEDVVKVLASPDFTSAPPETQRAIREALGVSLAPTPETSNLSPSLRALLAVPSVHQPTAPKPSVMDWLLGSFGRRKDLYEGKGAIESLGAAAKEKSEEIDLRKISDSAHGRENKTGDPGHFDPRPALNITSSLARFVGGSATPKNAALAGLTAIPQARPLVGAYGVASGGLELLKAGISGREPDESVPDFVERVLFAGSATAGGGALMAGGFRTNAGKLGQRIKRADYASGAPAGGQVAYKIALPDIVETIKTSGIKVKTVADVARAVEATNNRFNTQMALAEQPFAGDPIMPKQAIDALNKAADEMAPSQQAEARELRAEARRLAAKPMTLRELGREVRHQNSLFGSHAGKTSLELSTAKTRSSVAINDILRKNLRDTYVDYLESKYPGGQLRDMRMRQEQVLKLREALGTTNKNTGAIEKGHVENLKSLQSRHEGGPGGQVTGAVATPHGIRGFLRLPKGLRVGPETEANTAMKKAFREGPLRGPLPRRALPTLKPPALPPAPAPKGAGPLGSAPKPSYAPSKVETETYLRHDTIPRLREHIAEAKQAGNAADVAKWEGELHVAKQKLAGMSKQRAATALEKKHPEAAARLRKGLHIVESEE